MIQRVLNSKNFLACLLAAATGMFLYIRMPFPEDNLFFELMFLSAEQILAYKADDKEKRIGGLVLEVKGDFCKKIKEILVKHERVEDYIEIGLGAQYRYNPFQNDLDAYALAYSIASLLNNL